MDLPRDVARWESGLHLVELAVRLVRVWCGGVLAGEKKRRESVVTMFGKEGRGF